jgi:hypothetical protein
METMSLPVLVATRQTQGQRKNDFSWAVDNEPVRFGLECDGEAVDGRCGCRRSFSGMQSNKNTTTARVASLPITRNDFLRMLGESMKVAGWSFDEKDIQEIADELLMIASRFNEGDIVEKRGNNIQVRRS